MRQAVNVGGTGRIAPTISFEVQVFRTDHWVLERICRSEQEAREFAVHILPRHDGVRIVREFNRPGGQGTVETVIFTEMRLHSRRPIAISPIEEAPVCTASQQYLGPDSRQTISRLLRQYLEEKGLTASELLHNAGEMKRVMNFEALLPNAVSRVASIQARTTGEDVRNRRDDIYARIEELRTRAERAVARRNLPYPKEAGLPATMAEVERHANGDPEETDYLAKVVLCRDLVNIRNLLGKVEWILSLGGEDGIAGTAGNHAAQYIRVLDSLVADAIINPAVVQDLLGRQPDLSTALNRLVDIVEGSYEPSEREKAPAVTAVLSRWAASGQAPETRSILLESLVRSLRSTHPLTGDPHRQRDAFQTLAARLVKPTGVFGGARVAEALTLGFFRFIEQGGGEGRRLSMDGVLSLLPTGADRLAYLIALADSPAGQAEQAAVLDRLQGTLGHPGGIQGLMPTATPLKPKMQALAAVYSGLIGSRLREADKDPLADRLDRMVADYIVQARIIEKLDDPSAPLRVRATRLVQFAAADVLASPRARRIVRDQIIGHLRQPNFDGKFIEGLNSAEEKAQALRTFYDLLNRARFT
ncbi:hypothetical protein [Rhodospirillum centenum]|uniref:Uncharacterized protein n=1 Tax=Rhodospirillum centenum (strain ATCC 51521 / SW) TaxID=414684 RepID=B6ITE6_RHOCS|nr:hypothetical protein [Rhodospirillum centenum]ACI99164.1 conserved hypothetical protein [Rhodospirillum centenum SW]